MLDIVFKVLCMESKLEYALQTGVRGVDYHTYVQFNIMVFKIECFERRQQNTLHVWCTVNIVAERCLICTECQELPRHRQGPAVALSSRIGSLSSLVFELLIAGVSVKSMLNVSEIFRTRI